MSQSIPTVLALDFDGVICDGLIEYFQTAWRAYCNVWKPDNPTPPVDLAERFYALRPVVESGWEMPLVLRSLLLGTPDADILDHWSALTQPLLDAENLDKTQLAHQVDGVRDEWISHDLDHWLAQHRFYPGVIERLQQWQLDQNVELTIITTKEGRFVQKLLHQQGVVLTPDQIFGKEVKQPKAVTLRSRLHQDPGHPPTIWFIEDRLKTLQQVSTVPELDSVALFLADWGYNTVRDRDSAQNDPRIHLLSLKTFSQQLPRWLSDSSSKLPSG
ncbi:MAG: HAD family hydrolase [Synechococcales cyanobacterium T60_A2020_003]|nr:HAD family hydrolase [Synechococcales cyanobacterium T60_A2020_003]